MEKITIKTIPHSKQAYSTVGNYWETKDSLEVRVSDMGNPTLELATALHELIESHLCRLNGISFEDIEEFDRAYEKSRDDDDRHASCGCLMQIEPGMDVHAPYHEQHVFATKLEREFVSEASWGVYDVIVNKL